MPSLRQLEAVFVRYDERMEDVPTATMPVSTGPDLAAWIAAGKPVQVVNKAVAYSQVCEREHAMGLRFLCPLCFARNGGAVGTHMVVCWSRTAGTPEHVKPGPGRWRLAGTSLDDLSLMEEPGQTRSVQLLSGCNWHGFVTNGQAE